MKKIIIVLCCLLTAIIPVLSVNNFVNSYAYVDGYPRSDLYFKINIPLTPPVEEEFWEQSNFSFGTTNSFDYSLTDIITLDNGNLLGLMSIDYLYSTNQQTGLRDITISFTFKYKLPNSSFYDLCFIMYKYDRSLSYVTVSYVSSNWEICWGVDFDFIYPDYSYYITDYYMTSYNSLNSDRKMIIDKFFVWQQLLDTPVCTLDFATIDWQPVQSSTSYIIYKDNEYYITVSDSQFVTVVNGSYYVVAVDSSGTYANSSNSNTINVTVYNDDVGNGTNFFSLFSAIIDAQLHLFRSMLDWNILGINLLTLFKIILTIFLIVLVIKFILGKK